MHCSLLSIYIRHLWLFLIVLGASCFSYQLHPGHRYVGDSHICSPPRRCSSLYQTELLTPLLESTCGLWSERTTVKCKHLVLICVVFSYGGADRNTPWNPRFFDPFWTLSHSCTSAVRERGGRSLGNETLQSCSREQHGAASPFSLASPTEAPTLSSEVNNVITIIVCLRWLFPTPTWREQRRSRGNKNSSWLTLELFVARWHFVGHFVFLRGWLIVFFIFRGFNDVCCNKGQMLKGCWEGQRTGQEMFLLRLLDVTRLLT